MIPVIKSFEPGLYAGMTGTASLLLRSLIHSLLKNAEIFRGKSSFQAYKEMEVRTNENTHGS